MLTAEEVFGRPFGRKAAEELLGEINLTAAMQGLAFLLTRRQGPAGNSAAADAELLPQLPADLQERIRRVSDANTVICSEQGILMSMRVALRVSPETGGHDRVGLLVPVILAIQQDLRAPGTSPLRFEGDTTNALFREIVRSHAFSRRPDRRSQMAHFVIRWEDLPAELGRTGRANPAEAFAEFTGVELADFSALAVSFWAQGLNRPGEIILWPAQLDWDEGRKARALALIASDVPKLRRAISEVVGEAEQWAFDEFRRWPVLQLGTGWLVLAPEFLFERQFGAPPLLDIRTAMTPEQKKARWTHIDQTFQDICEKDALIGLRNIAKNDGATFYSEDDLRQAFGRRGVQIPDAALDAGDRWIVVEISSRKLTRDTVVRGDAAALSKDLDFGIVKKLGQVDSVVAQLVADESRLTGAPAKRRVRYVRVLVVVDGFPVNPMTYEAIQRRVALPTTAGRPIEPGHVIDQEELDMVESVTERTKLTFAGLLEGHERGSLWRSALKDWMLVERKLQVDLAQRLKGPSKRAWRHVILAFGPEAEPPDE